MSQKIKGLLLTLLLVVSFGVVYAHEDDYLVGLNSFKDGLYSLAVPSLESYLKGETEKKKADYAHFLLYGYYLEKKVYKKSLAHLEKVIIEKDPRMSEETMVQDKMLILSHIDCQRADDFLSVATDTKSLNYFLDSKCRLSELTGKLIAEKAQDNQTKIKLVAKLPDNSPLVPSIFDSMDISKMDNRSKKYFSLYFYKAGDMERYGKVSKGYMDADVAGLELDSIWQKGDKEAFISRYEAFKEKYKIVGANACRAIEVYKNKNVQFDCDIINDCMQKYSVDFVTIKGACLIKSGDKDKLSEFVDSLRPTIFPGICGYGEYIFHNDLYTGSRHNKFAQCDERHKIANVLLKKGENQAIINMLIKETSDMDKFYTAVALRNLDKKDAADELINTITDQRLKDRYAGGGQ